MKPQGVVVRGVRVWGWGCGCVGVGVGVGVGLVAWGSNLFSSTVPVPVFFPLFFSSVLLSFFSSFPPSLKLKPKPEVDYRTDRKLPLYDTGPCVTQRHLSVQMSTSHLSLTATKTTSTTPRSSFYGSTYIRQYANCIVPYRATLLYHSTTDP